MQPITHLRRRITPAPNPCAPSVASEMMRDPMAANRCAPRSGRPPSTAHGQRAHRSPAPIHYCPNRGRVAVPGRSHSIPDTDWKHRTTRNNSGRPDPQRSASTTRLEDHARPSRSMRAQSAQPSQLNRVSVIECSDTNDSHRAPVWAETTGLPKSTMFVRRGPS